MLARQALRNLIPGLSYRLTCPYGAGHRLQSDVCLEDLSDVAQIIGHSSPNRYVFATQQDSAPNQI